MNLSMPMKECSTNYSLGALYQRRHLCCVYFESEECRFPSLQCLLENFKGEWGCHSVSPTSLFTLMFNKIFNKILCLIK